MSALRPGRRTGTARELAQRLGVSERTIRRYVAEPKKQFEERTEARHERIRALREEGLSYRAIAAEVGVSIGTVNYALRKQRESDDA